MVDRLQNKVFVTRDEGVSFTSYDVAFTPSIIKFQGTTVPKSTEGTLPEHILGYETETMSVCVCVCVCVCVVHVNACMYACLRQLLARTVFVVLEWFQTMLSRLLCLL